MRIPKIVEPNPYTKQSRPGLVWVALLRLVERV